MVETCRLSWLKIYISRKIAPHLNRAAIQLSELIHIHGKWVFSLRDSFHCHGKAQVTSVIMVKSPGPRAVGEPALMTRENEV
jgi:hypothetical protein